MTTDKTKEKVVWFVFSDEHVLLRHTKGVYALPEGERDPLPTHAGQPVLDIVSDPQTLGKAYFADSLTPLPPLFEWMRLRSSFDVLSAADYTAAGKAFQMLYWDMYSAFCPRCGVQTERIAPNAKKCPRCGHEIYPRLSPAVIVLIRKEDQILLVHAHNFRGKFHGLVAGYVEPGETLEEAVVREVKEETGLTITNLTYFDSQPWPYPNTLMIGFMADYASGELHLQKEELSDGSFYPIDRLPAIPRKVSLARQLIDAWLEQNHITYQEK